MLQTTIGKLYVLSHFYNMYVVADLLLFLSCLPPCCRFRSNARSLFVGEQEQPQEQPSTAYVFTLTVPALHGTSATALNAPEDHPSISYTGSFGRTDSGRQ